TARVWPAAAIAAKHALLAQFRGAAMGDARAARRSRSMAGLGHRAAAIALPDPRAAPTGLTRQSPLPENSDAAVCRLHARRVAHGLRRRLLLDPRDYQGAARARRALSGAGAAGERGRQRRRRDRTSRTGRAARHVYRLERVDVSS